MESVVRRNMSAAISSERERAGDQHRPDVAGQEQGLQPLHVIARRHDAPRTICSGIGMLASSNRKPEKNTPGRKATIIAIWLARNCVRATVEIIRPRPERDQQEHRGEGVKQDERAAHREWNRNSAASTQTVIAQSPEDEIRRELADHEFDDADGRGEQRLDGAALPFARHHQRGQQRADHHLDQRDGAGHQEAPALELGVEPDARLDVDAGRARGAPAASAR